MRVKFRRIRRFLLSQGWVLIDQVGSHEQYAHAEKPGKVTTTAIVHEVLMVCVEQRRQSD